MSHSHFSGIAPDILTPAWACILIKVGVFQRSYLIENVSNIM